MTYYPFSLCFTLILLLAGCTAMTPQPDLKPPLTHYESTVVEAATGNSLSVEQLADRLVASDVVVIGEYHGHQGAHLLQSQLQAALYQRRPEQVLSLEQFDVDHQLALDRYLAGETGEAELREDGEAWSNYTSSYRPLVEFAKARGLPVVAANAPAQVVRCVGREGVAYLDSLEDGQKQYIPDKPFAGTPAYREKFFRIMGGHHGSAARDAMAVEERLENSYNAQLLRDNTMASRIIAALEQHPGYQVIHLTGTFHSEGRLGTVASLRLRQPDLSVAVISPVFVDDVSVSGMSVGEQDGELPIASNRKKGDYLYFLLPLPEEYRDAGRQREAMMKQFQKATGTTCD